MAVYKDLNQPIGLRMEAAKAALPYEKPRLASTETKIVDEFDGMSAEELDAWLDEQAEARVKARQRSHEPQQHNGDIGTARPTMARGSLYNPAGRDGIQTGPRPAH